MPSPSWYAISAQKRSVITRIVLHGQINCILIQGDTECTSLRNADDITQVEVTDV